MVTGTSAEVRGRVAVWFRRLRGAALFGCAVALQACSSGAGGGVFADGGAGLGGGGGSAGSAGSGAGGASGSAGTGGGGGAAGAGGAAGSAGACAVPAPGALDGEYLFTLSFPIKPESPLVFLAKVSSQSGFGGGTEMTWKLEPLDRIDRKTPVGGLWIPEPIAISSTGTIDINPPLADVPGEANPISGSDMSFDLSRLLGTFCGTGSFYCGTADGTITKPISLNVDASTWTLQKIESAAVYPAPLINCAKQPAGPPPSP